MLVTGAASGIGPAIAQAAADRGTNLVLVDRSPDALDAARHSLSRAVRVESFAADVTDLDALTTTLADSRARRDALTTVAQSASIEVLGTVD